MDMIFPNKIKLGTKIGVTAMSSGLADERGIIRADSAKENFARKGLEIYETENVRHDEKFVSSPAETRVKEFLELWESEEISYILLACGGEFLMETLPYLHAAKERILTAKPKWLQGYSDISLLNFYMTTNFGVATIHSNSYSGFAMVPWDKALDASLHLVQNIDAYEKEYFIQHSFEFYQGEKDRSVDAACKPYNFTERVLYKVLPNLHENEEYEKLTKLFKNDEGKVSGQKFDSIRSLHEKINFSGRLIGGCMDVLKILLGTPFDNTKAFCNSFDEGMLWYLENCEMAVTDVKRTLWQMKLAGWFDNANGIIIGRTDSKEEMCGFAYEDALYDALHDLNIPIIYDVDFGHVAPQWTLVNGATAEFEYFEGKGTLKQILKK